MGKFLRRFSMGFSLGILTSLFADFTYNNLESITNYLFWIWAVGTGILLGFIVYFWLNEPDREKKEVKHD